VEFIIPLYFNFSTSFQRHTAHHQELTNCNWSLWLYLRLWLPAAAVRYRTATDTEWLYQKLYLYNCPPEDEHIVAWNM